MSLERGMLLKFSVVSQVTEVEHICVYAPRVWRRNWSFDSLSALLMTFPLPGINKICYRCTAVYGRNWLPE